MFIHSMDWRVGVFILMRFIFTSTTSIKGLALTCDTDKKKYRWDTTPVDFMNATIVRLSTLKDLKELEIAFIKNGFEEI